MDAVVHPFILADIEKCVRNNKTNTMKYLTGVCKTGMAPQTLGKCMEYIILRPKGEYMPLSGQHIQNYVTYHWNLIYILIDW
jgi:hypothetical protein